MNPSDPAVRASHLKEDLEALVRLDPALAVRVRARVRPETLAAIDDASRMSWLPIALNVEIIEAVLAEGGPVATRRWARASFLVALEGFFKPLVELAVSLFQPSPPALYRYVPRVWTATYRSCGTFRSEDAGPGRSRLVGEGFPPPLRAAPFVTALAGSIETTFDLCAYAGEVAVEPPEDGTVRYLVTWAPRR